MRALVIHNKTQLGFMLGKDTKDALFIIYLCHYLCYLLFRMHYLL